MDCIVGVKIIFKNSFFFYLFGVYFLVDSDIIYY